MKSPISVKAFFVQGEVYFRAQDVIDWHLDEAIRCPNSKVGDLYREAARIFTETRRRMEASATPMQKRGLR